MRWMRYAIIEVRSNAINGTRFQSEFGAMIDSGLNATTEPII